MFSTLFRRIRPFLFPKNSFQEHWVRYAFANYSRFLIWKRGFLSLQEKSEQGEIPLTENIFHFLQWHSGQTLESLRQELKQSTAEWILIASAPIRIAPSALAEIAQIFRIHPQADLVYSDGDWIDPHGRRFNPWFKAAFAIDSLRAQNYIVPFFAIRKSLGDSLGWFDSAAGSAWAEDLVWRAVEQARQVVHIPQVLYHQTGERPASFQDEQSALERHLERIGWLAQVEPGPVPRTFHLRYRLREQPLVSIIIPNYEFADELRRCVGSILEKSTYQNFEILILENNSCQAETFRLYEQLQVRDARVRVLEYHHAPFNYSEINNFGARQARGEVLLFLNNDTQVITPDWLEQMLMYAQRPDVGAVGAKMYYPQDLIQHVGVIAGMFGSAGHQFVNFPRDYAGYYHNTLLTQNYSAVTAACLMMRRAEFDHVGGFETSYRVAYNDIDLCMKIRENGRLIVWTPHAELYHHEALSRGYDSNTAMLERLKREREMFMLRWRVILQSGDPYYNPNLALDRGYYSLCPGARDQSPRAMPGLALNASKGWY